MERITPPPGAPPVIDLSNPLLWFIAIAMVVVVFLSFRMPRKKSAGSRGGWYRKPHPAAANIGVIKPIATNLADPLAQLEAVHQAQFETTRLLNNEEARILPILEDAVRQAGYGHRVMAQTSLGELIRPVPSKGDSALAKNAFSAINSKRLDFAIINRAGFLVCAVEYQGSGHYQDRAFMRDAVKREALRKAGVPMIEAEVGILAESLVKRVTEIISPVRHA